MRAEDASSGFGRTMAATSTTAFDQTQALGTEPRGTLVTAEIPAVAPPGNYSVAPAANYGVAPSANYGVLLPDGTVWYPGSKKRLPAPLPLRIAVWTLAFLVLVVGAATVVIRTHPHWVDPLRRVVPSASGLSVLTPVANSPAHHHVKGVVTTAPKVPAMAVALSSPQPSGLPYGTTAYSVTGTSSYSVVVRAGSNDCYAIAYHLVNGQISGYPIFNGNLTPDESATIPATGPIDLELYETGASISVVSGFKSLGTVPDPSGAPWHLRFLTTGSS